MYPLWQIERAEKEREARKKDPEDDGVEYVDFDGESLHGLIYVPTPCNLLHTYIYH